MFNREGAKIAKVFMEKKEIGEILLFFFFSFPQSSSYFLCVFAVNSQLLALL
jgi:hypothetical protein